MIVPMKRLTVLCLAKARAEALEVLRELGVVHLVPVQPPESRDLEVARTRLASIQRVLDVLPAKPGQPPSGQPGELVVDRALYLLEQKRELEESLVDLRLERRRLAPYTSFNPDVVRELRSRGVFIKLAHLSVKQRLETPAGVVAQVLNQDATGSYYAFIGREDFPVPGAELKLPELSRDELDRRISDLEGKLLATGDALWAHAGDHAVVRAEARAAEDALRFLEAREGMGQTDPVAYLQGFCPSEAVEQIRAAAAREGWGLIVADPEGDEPVPTLIRSPRWVKPIKVVFDAIGILPGYREIDISACFLLFLSLFFAMLVGDAGYGLLFIGLTWLARRKWPRAPLPPFAFLYIMGAATVVWGAFSGVFFGLGQTPAWLEPFKIKWLGDEANVMRLCFLIGATHLTVAHLWNAVRSWRSLGALAQLGWIGTTWTMFFTARMMVLGETFPGFMMPVFLASVVLIVLFMTPVKQLKTEWFNHVMLPLNLVSNFVDVVSYLRLFAVGVAGFAVANSFNDMALAGVSGLGSGLVAAFILFFGHTLNILLSAMGVLVHGVRLNTLEFSSHLGVQWSGVAYRPFARSAADSSEH